ncbi:hypothetical protein [Pontibacter harenae]|nr:hypothetical protein [Pontibacter harenae]
MTRHTLGRVLRGVGLQGIEVTCLPLLRYWWVVFAVLRNTAQ